MDKPLDCLDQATHAALAALAYRWLVGQGWSIVKIPDETVFGLTAKLKLSVPDEMLVGRLLYGNPDVLGRDFAKWYHLPILRDRGHEST